MDTTDRHRREIDRLDRELEVSRIWTDAAREHGLPGCFASRILNEVLGHSRRVTAAIQGGPRSFSDLAVDQLLAGHHAQRQERLYLDSFTAAVDAVESGRADHALLPIENTIAGSLNEVYRLLGERSLTILAEEVLPVEHCLAGHPEAALCDGPPALTIADLAELSAGLAGQLAASRRALRAGGE